MTGTRTHTTKEGHTIREGLAPPHPPKPSRHCATPKGHCHTQAPGRPPWRRTPTHTRRRNLDLTPHQSHRVAPTDHKFLHKKKEGTPTQGEGYIPTRRTAENTTQPTTAP